MEREMSLQLGAMSKGGETGFVRESEAAVSVRSETPGDSVSQLVCASRAGCRKAFGELLNVYSKRIYRTIFAITKNAEDTEDAMQDTFLRAFMAIGGFEGRSSFYSWLTRIAINSALMVLRKRRSRRESSLTAAPDWDGETVPMDFADSAADPEEACYQEQRREGIFRAIGRLKPALREVVQARVVEERSIKEVAERFNISEATAKSRLHRARLRLDRFRSDRYEPRAQAVLAVSSVACSE